MDYQLPVWPYAYGGPSGTGQLKLSADDFQVEEQLSFEPEGSGEHVFLKIEKRGENTEFVVRHLARFAGVRQRDIGYAGLKDRHARTIQWFSIWLPGQADMQWQRLETESIRVLQAVRHIRKLKHGAIKANHFSIAIKNWQGDISLFTQQLKQIKLNGFPNYFAEQRFGHNGQNINKALAVFQGKRVKRQQRSLYLSAVRSWLFNQILAERIRLGCWNRLMKGDLCQLNATHSVFLLEDVDDLLEQRCQQGDIHPTAVLYGAGKMAENTDAGALEQAVLARYPELTEGLQQAGLKAERRTMRVLPTGLHASQLNTDEWLLDFSLPSGSYATALLRELINFS